MGLHIELIVEKVQDGTVFDLDQANTDLMNQQYGGLAELYCEFTNHPKFEGPFKMRDDKLLIGERCDSEFYGYNDRTTVWGCYGPAVFQTIANNISEGKIVFQVSIEGNDNEFYICTPGKFEKKFARDLF